VVGATSSVLWLIASTDRVVFFGARVTTEDDYFVLDGDLDPLIERKTSRRGVA